MRTSLQQVVMRRIYTAYLMRLAFGSRARYLAVMALSLVGLAKVVSLIDIFRNFSSVRVSQVGDFIVSAFIHADGITLCALAVFAYGFIAFLRSDRMPKQPAFRQVPI